MKKLPKAKELFSDVDISKSFPFELGVLNNIEGYNRIVSCFGEIKLASHDEDYQGDSRYVIYDPETKKYGWLQIGWGSCSGCDAFYGCRSYEDMDALIAELYEDIVWFDTVKDAIDFFISHNWEGDYSYHEEKQREFVKQAILYFTKEYMLEKEREDAAKAP